MYYCITVIQCVAKIIQTISHFCCLLFKVKKNGLVALSCSDSRQTTPIITPVASSILTGFPHTRGKHSAKDYI